MLIATNCPSGRPRASSEKRTSVGTRATRTGPSTMPMGAKARIAPYARKTERVEIWARPGMTRGRTKVSADEPAPVP
jgi:hypothetical protein